MKNKKEEELHRNLSKWANYFIKRKNLFSWGFIGLCGVGLLLVRFEKFFVKDKLQHYWEVNSLFDKWKTSLDDKDYALMLSKMNKKDFLILGDQGSISQILLNNNRYEDSYAFGKESILRSEKENPLNSMFSNVSFLIEKQDYIKALENSLELNDYILSISDLKDSQIYFYNLLRISLLHKNLNNHFEEKQVIESLLSQKKHLDKDFISYLDVRSKSLK